MSQSLSFFISDTKITQELSDIIFDSSINNRYPNLQSYLDSQKIKYHKDDIPKLIHLIEEEVYKAIFYLSHLLYYIMEQSNEWSDAGEQQIKISFCRNLLRKDPLIQLSQEDAFQFLSLVEENINQLNLHEFSLQTARDRYKNFQFNILGTLISSYKTTDINRILHFCGSKKYLQGGFYGDEKEFIFGAGSSIEKGGYDIIYLENELIRTPNNIVAMAAIIGNREIYIRSESLKTIFAQKWLEYFADKDPDDEALMKTNFHRRISEGIKRKTLSLYDATSYDGLLSKKQDLIYEMGQTILFHELGHGITQHEILPVEFAAIGEATKIFGENIYTSLLEFMADFAPIQEGILGPIQNMVRISKKDLNQASRMYYMYMSDTWFYDTDDEYMYIYSDLMSLILMKYIEPDQSIRFDQLEADIQYRAVRTESDKMTMFERLLQLYIHDVEEIRSIVQNATFTLLEQQLDFNKIKKLMIEQFRKNDGFVHTDTYEFLVPFWTNMLGYVNSISDAGQQLKQFIQDQEKKILMKMFILSAGKKKAEKYQYDHRQYQVDHMKELKLMV